MCVFLFKPHASLALLSNNLLEITFSMEDPEELIAISQQLRLASIKRRQQLKPLVNNGPSSEEVCYP